MMWNVLGLVPSLIGIGENGFNFADIYLRLKSIEKGVIAQRGNL